MEYFSIYGGNFACGDNMVIEHIFLSETLNNIVVLKQNTYSSNVVNITLITEHGEDKVNLSDVDELVKNLKLSFISMGVVCD